MTHSEIKQAALRRPFRPFALRLTDGQLLEIDRQDRIALHPKTTKTVVVFDDAGTYRIVDVRLVTELQVA
jgi:hypothetical protein